jgi:hypothetical protein
VACRIANPSLLPGNRSIKHTNARFSCAVGSDADSAIPLRRARFTPPRRPTLTSFRTPVRHSPSPALSLARLLLEPSSRRPLRPLPPFSNPPLDFFHTNGRHSDPIGSWGGLCSRTPGGTLRRSGPVFLRGVPFKEEAEQERGPDLERTGASFLSWSGFSCCAAEFTITKRYGTPTSSFPVLFPLVPPNFPAPAVGVLHCCCCVGRWLCSGVRRLATLVVGGDPAERVFQPFTPKDEDDERGGERARARATAADPARSVLEPSHAPRPRPRSFLPFLSCLACSSFPSFPSAWMHGCMLAAVGTGMLFVCVCVCAFVRPLQTRKEGMIIPDTAGREQAGRIMTYLGLAAAAAAAAAVSYWAYV